MNTTKQSGVMNNHIVCTKLYTDVIIDILWWHIVSNIELGIDSHVLIYNYGFHDNVISKIIK
jgi:hypothetical protein